jgi:hypothetical protein
MLHSSFAYAKAILLLSVLCVPAKSIANEPAVVVSIFWSCVPKSAGGQTCSLSVFANQPTFAVTGPVVLRGRYFIRKGNVLGQGPYLAGNDFEAACTLISPYVSCDVPNLVTLGVGVSPIFDFASKKAEFNIVGTTPSRLFDWDGDGTPSVNDSLLLSRYLLGFRGPSLTQGVPITGGKTTAEIQDEIGWGAYLGWFQFRHPTAYPTMTDAQIFARCVRGLTGQALVGSSGASAAAAENQCSMIKSQQ